ncbi:predicted protein [Chaetomium globosum CBS 148.51]|uniref:Uncharacterized protein n=1 Tax=Chaetomium globosum (strain ATCC 6205 / CBS 148.51 / DSM 1962 / NBRC 6347 / NRRL 1970) TaxID=306901 RepID=Q2H4B3_CHAGB|nr:uncharacterized protein CHGG_06502 [Chaetomium globosum CBS 148.51]EAQ89883.1 predicted protein [Chaetomium globosum CBS 148.51]
MFRGTLRRFKPLPANKSPPIFQNYPIISTQTTPGADLSPQALQAFEPSERVAKFAAEHKISFPFALRLMPGQKVKDFPLRVSIAPRNVFSMYHLKYLGPFEHPLISKVLYTYEQEKKTKPLWCYVQGFSTADNSNAVVRQTSERVVRAALFRALNAAGYDSFGKSLDGSKKDLRGSIRVAVAEPKAIMKIEFDKLLGYLTKLVANAIPRLDGSSPGPPQRPRKPSTSRG